MHTKSDIAKLPVAFGFNIDDKNGTSKKLAKSATKRWLSQGKDAVMNGVGCPAWVEVAMQGNRKQKAGTTSSSSVSPTKQPKRARMNPTTPPSESAGPDFPTGWTTKTFARSASSKHGSKTYKVYYSPQLKKSFRSRKGALIFVEMLKEPEIMNDEEAAFKVFKERGHKL